MVDFWGSLALLIVGIILYCISRVPELDGTISRILSIIGSILIVIGIILVVVALIFLFVI
jgi:hypothetical protein